MGGDPMTAPTHDPPSPYDDWDKDYSEQGHVPQAELDRQFAELSQPKASAHDPAIVKMATISRLFDEYMDADGKLRSYLLWLATNDAMIDNDVARELHVEAEAAKARYFEAVAR
jgi:hypothetical protein